MLRYLNRLHPMFSYGQSVAQNQREFCGSAGGVGFPVTSLPFPQEALNGFGVDRDESCRVRFVCRPPCVCLWVNDSPR